MDRTQIELLKRMAVFATVVEAESFTEAGRRLDLAKSAVSRHVTLLEEELGVQLLQRSTRSLHLTDRGRAFYQSCARILEEAGIALDRIEHEQDELRGTLRLGGPTLIARRVLLEPLREFMRLHPSLHVELSLENRQVNLIEEGLDVSLRIGHLQEGDYIVKRLLTTRYVLCASPQYIARNGAPRDLGELSEHPWLLLLVSRDYDQWIFRHEQQEFPIQAQGTFRTNSPVALVEAVHEGLGLAPMLDLWCKEHLEAGTLVELLPDYELTHEHHLYAVYPRRRFLPRKVSLFIEFLEDWLERHHP